MLRLVRLWIKGDYIIFVIQQVCLGTYIKIMNCLINFNDIYLTCLCTTEYINFIDTNTCYKMFNYTHFFNVILKIIFCRHFHNILLREAIIYILFTYLFYATRVLVRRHFLCCFLFIFVVSHVNLKICFLHFLHLHNNEYFSLQKRTLVQVLALSHLYTYKVKNYFLR